jgi:hypothetical protein
MMETGIAMKKLYVDFRIMLMFGACFLYGGFFVRPTGTLEERLQTITVVVTGGMR